MDAAQTGFNYLPVQVRDSASARFRMAEDGWRLVGEAALGMGREEYILRHMAQWKPLVLVAAEAGGVGIWQGY